METEQKPTQEELAAEQAAMAEAKEDEVRANITQDYGLDPEKNADLITKLVEKELGHKKALSTAIGQKVKIRNERDELKTKIPPSKPPVVEQKPADLDKTVDAKVEEKLQARDLAGLPYPDDLKSEIKRVAQIQGVSILQAVNDPYVKNRIESYEKTKQAEAAAIGKSRGGGGSSQKFTSDPPDVDMNTPEGRKKYEEWKDWMKKQGY